MRARHFFAGLAATVLVGSMSSAAVAQYRPEYRGTYDQQMACTGDVFRLCGREIPDEGRITSCLRDNVPSLSRGCRAVFEPTGSVQNPRDRRDVYQRDRDVRRDRDNFNYDDQRRQPSYDDRRDSGDDD